jgi:hypothetical protein
MSRKGITQRSVEYPTAKAELTILLVDVNGQTEPVRWQSRRNRLAGRWKQVVQRVMGDSNRRDV